MLFPFRKPPSALQIFGKHLMCKDLDAAMEVARRHRIDTVTMEGDCAHRKGSLEGGYESSSARRIEFFRAVQEKSDAIAALASEREKLAARIEELRRLADQKGSEAAKLEAAAEAHRRDLGALGEDLSFRQQSLRALQASEAAAGKYVREQAAARAGLAERLAELKKELETELSGQASPAEQARMDELLARASAAEKDLVRTDSPRRTRPTDTLPPRRRRRQDSRLCRRARADCSPPSLRCSAFPLPRSALPR